ncbi:MAG TPA: hypothetical protein VF067_06725 [Sphingomicrobium sp.]
MYMFLTAAAFAAAPVPAPTPRPAAASAQALATIRIISGVEVHFGGARAGDGLATRDTIIRSPDGNQPAKLIEFQ